MKRIYLTLTVIICFYTSLFAQARITVAEFQKTQQPAIENEIKFSQTTVAKAINEKLETLGYKGKETKGYVLYKAVTIADLGPETYDLYFKTTYKSKKEKDVSVVTLMISKGNENFVSEANDAILIENSKRFLENLLTDIIAYDLSLQITEQEVFVKKHHKKLEEIEEQNHELLKKKKKIEEDIELNLKAQETEKAEIEKQKQILETLKSREKIIKNN